MASNSIHYDEYEQQEGEYDGEGGMSYAQYQQLLQQEALLMAAMSNQNTYGNGQFVWMPYGGLGGGEVVRFDTMTEEELRAWVVQENGGQKLQQYAGEIICRVAAEARFSAACVAWLLDEGFGDANGRWRTQRPLHLASSREKVSILIAHGADPTLRDSKGEFPLMVQGRAGKADCVGRLLEDACVRKDIDEMDVHENEGIPALGIACFEGQPPDVRTVELMLAAGACPNISFHSGWQYYGTPLEHF